MSGIAKAIKKVFKSNIFKTIVVAAAIWFTAGTASAYFAAPEAGIGAAMSSSASTMWGQTTQFFGAEAAASTGSNVVATPLAGSAAQVATPLAESAVIPAATSAAAVAPAAEGGMFAWLKANPMATMMLGQGAAGAYGGYLDDKQAERESDERANRGLMGFDASGKYAGIVDSQKTTDEIVADPGATARPVVAGQQINAPTVASQQIPVPREDLTKLTQQGQLIRRG